MTVRSRTRRGKRRWFIEIPYRSSTGKSLRFRRDASVQTLSAARTEDARRQKLLALTGVPFEAGSADLAESDVAATTFADAVKMFFDAYAPSRLKPSTIRGYENVIRTHLMPRFATTPIGSIDAVAVRKLDGALVARGMSVSTRCTVLCALRSVVRRFAPEAGLLEEAPVLPRLPRVGLKITQAMTEAEFKAALAVASPTLRRAMLLAGRAGLRAGEIRGLRPRDVDLKAKELVVRVSICRGIEGPPKSGHERRVPLLRELAEELSDLAKPSRRRERVSMSPRGRVWSETSLGQQFRRACETAGIGHWRFHDLRHFFITGLFRSSAPAPVVQLIAGHLHLSVTQRYSHATQDDVVNVMRSFDRALQSA